MNKYPSAHDQRRKDLGEIHRRSELLGMDTKDKNEGSEYRAMVYTVAGKHSAADLDLRGRKLILNHLGDLMKAHGLKMGFEGKPTGIKAELQPLMGKIEALLADMKLPWKYAAAIAKRQTSAQGKGIARLEWLNAAQLHDVVTALVKKQQKGAPQ